jgi:hypothetical protein
MQASKRSRNKPMRQGAEMRSASSAGTSARWSGKCRRVPYVRCESPQNGFRGLPGRGLAAGSSEGALGPNAGLL